VREWSADVGVDEGLVRRLIGGQFPEVDLGSLRLFAEGWDNAVWVADERWAFRFPRRTIAIPGVERELGVLPRLAPLLPLPIPTPVFLGRPAEGYPWPFFGALLIPGQEIADAALDDAARARLGRPLARFLRQLHTVEVAEFAELPFDFNRRADMAFRVPRTRERLAEMKRLGLWRPPASVAGWLEAAGRLPVPEPTVVAHGDLHFRHVLVDEDGALSGVIDWGDVCLADPSIDLMLLWSFLPPEERAEFVAEYGPVTEEQLLRARVLALFVCGALAAYGHHEGLPNVEREAVEGLARAASGPSSP
jgi:aminoglycoside phosphotransferase (APT) family kinase protein